MLFLKCMQRFSNTSNRQNLHRPAVKVPNLFQMMANMDNMMDKDQDAPMREPNKEEEPCERHWVSPLRKALWDGGDNETTPGRSPSLVLGLANVD